MKKILAILSVLCLVFTASCGKPEHKIIYRDTLIIENIC